MFKKSILSIILIIVLTMPVIALDNSAYSPTCINPSYDTSDVFLVTGNNASDGYVRSGSITSGYFSPSFDRVNSWINLLCVICYQTT